MKKILFSVTMLTAMLFGLNINTASKEDLLKIKGIGEKKAEAILKYRRTHKINSIDDLTNVKGIGSKILFNIKNDVYKKSLKSKKVKRIRNKKDMISEKFNDKKRKINEKIENKKEKISFSKTSGRKDKLKKAKEKLEKLKEKRQKAKDKMRMKKQKMTNKLFN